MPDLRRWREVSPYLDQAFSLSGEELRDWLATVRIETPEVAELLESFLEEHRLLENNNFLESVEPALAHLHFAGQTIGAYTLNKKIGQGGMGSVWLAERTDGEVQFKVAIKLLNAENYGPVWHNRFLTERQLLASLNHASVVHLLDAGRTQDGKPYLVMEFVEGVTIDAYCTGIELRDLLRLFLHVCAGVSHAHQRLIIHRDLKPSNILVDGTAQPKLLDFGIAKLVEDSGEITQYGERMLTPHYASPEQMNGGPQTTATDIYSLGAVLYKLLTGSSPHELSAGTTRAVDAMVGTRLVGTKKILKPSCLNTTLASDIDHILGKALRIEPEERYPSVDAFADDLRAFLASKPVQARPGTVWYRTRKLLRRQWILACAVALVVSGSLSAFYVVSRERSIAQRRFQQVRELAHTVVFDLQDELAKLEGSTKLRELTVRTGIQYLDSLSGSAGGDIALQKEIAGAYLKIGDAQGFPTKPNLGRIEDALASYRKAGKLYEHMAKEDPANLPDLARYYLQYAALVRFTHDLRRARDLAQSALTTFEQIALVHQPDLQARESYITAWCTLGDMDEDLGQFRQSWNEFSRCGDLARKWLKEGGGRSSLLSLAQADERVGTAAQALGLLPEAERAFDEGQAVLDRLLASEPRNPTLHRRRALLDHYRSDLYFSDTSVNLGKPALALESAKNYLRQAQQRASSDPNDTAAQFSLAIAMFQVSFCLVQTHPDSAVEMAKDSVRVFDDLIASGKKSYLVTSRRIRAMVRLGEAELNARRVENALQTAESALLEVRPLADKAAEAHEQVLFVSALILAGRANAGSGKYERAEKLLQEARDKAALIATGAQIQQVIPLAQSEMALCRFYADRRRTDQARACTRRFLDLWVRFPEPKEFIDRQKAMAQQLLASLN